VQHHHAHAAACLAEHGLESGLALVFDGTGLGPDGSIWGAELLDVDPTGFRRLATFAPAPLPGGDKAVMEPARQLIARWIHAGVEISGAWRRHLGVEAESIGVWTAQIERSLNSPLTHAAGRVFDAFSAGLGLVNGAVTYEGQAAVRLEARASEAGSPAPVLFDSRERDGLLEIDWAPAFTALTEKIPSSQEIPALALGFHQAVRDAALRMIEFGQDRTDTRPVCLTGGVFMNRVLTRMLLKAFKAKGVDVRIHRSIPPNDGGIALGQAWIAGQQSAAVQNT
jgi:hydrogenase maturation protein HypF